MRSLSLVASAAVIALLLAVSPSSVTAQLSIPRGNDTLRASIVCSTSGLIANEPREIVLHGVSYANSNGSVPRASQSFAGSNTNNSLYAEMVAYQDALMLWTENSKLHQVHHALETLVPFDYHNLSEYHRVYWLLERNNLIKRPKALNISDESFGARRFGILGHNLRAVQVGVQTNYLDSLSDNLVQDVCGHRDIKTAVANKTVFVADFSVMGQYTDKAKSATKYAPDVIGFFCLNKARSAFLPLAIAIEDTKLLYTKNDTFEDWMLAKMALDATELNYQLMQQHVQVHRILVPIQVEMIRSMAPNHPVHALLQYHFATNFAIENRSRSSLFSVNSTFDQTFAFGAAGALKFAMHTSEYMVDEDFHAELEVKGLTDTPHRMARCGLVFYDAIQDFLSSYLEAFYANESEIQNDLELQIWANRTAAQRSVRGFPGKFTGFADLTNILTNLVFQSTARHYMMHGPTTWHGIAAPFTTPALWNKPLPTAKRTKLNPLDYTMPVEFLPMLSEFAASAMRPVPEHLSMLKAYGVAPFVNETKLAMPILRFQKAMRRMEEWGNDWEETNNQFDSHVRPSKVPVFSYV